MLKQKNILKIFTSLIQVYKICKIVSFQVSFTNVWHLAYATFQPEVINRIFM